MSHAYLSGEIVTTLSTGRLVLGRGGAGTSSGSLASGAVTAPSSLPRENPNTVTPATGAAITMLAITASPTFLAFVIADAPGRVDASDERQQESAATHAE
jgi:hypothetical protein